MTNPTVKVTNAALQDTEGGGIILRGVIDPSSLGLLQVAPYQREVLPISQINSLVDAFRTGTVPDIELGMRGQDFRSRDDSCFLKDPVFIIDGLQRVTAALQLIKLEKDAAPKLGASIHFDTTEAWERDRFRILNAERAKLSSNILIRNLKDENPAVAMLINLCADKHFVLNGRVCWSQRMSRGELISALTFLKVIGRLHLFAGPGASTSWSDLAKSLSGTMENVGKNTMRANAMEFFRIVDQCWGIQRVTFREGSTHLRQTFLTCLASIFSNHYDFWRGEDEKKLFVEASLVRKLALFPVADPTVVNLASTSGKAKEMLYLMLLDHINSGKRTRRLKPRGQLIALSGEADDVVENGTEIAEEAVDGGK